MSSPDDAVPEPHKEGPFSAETGEISMLRPEDARESILEIKALAESRGDDSQVHELLDIPPTGPIPVASQGRDTVDDDALSDDELRDAWPLLDLEERGDGLRVLPREDAEEFFIQLSPRDHADL